MRRFLLPLLALSAPAWAHLMPAQQGTINLVGDRAYVLVSLPVSALGGDVDGDGLLSKEELRGQLAALRQRAREGFRLLDGETAGEPIVLHLIAEPDHDKAAGSTHVVMMATFQFAGPPARPRVEAGLFGQREEEQRLTLRAQRGTLIDPVVLTPARPAQGLFQPAWQAAAAYVEHALQRTKLLLVRLVSG